MNVNRVEFERSFGTFEQLTPSDLPEIVFSGRSNVGKSSMINKLFNRRALARVSSVPGKTATINFFRLDQVRFADLPGYGYAKVSKSEKKRWDDLIGGYFADGRDILLVFLLLDMRHPPSQDDLKMANFLIENEYPFVCVLTKADKLTKANRLQRLTQMKEELPCGTEITFVPFSTQTGEGVEEIRGIIDELAITEEAARDDKGEANPNDQ